MPIVTVGMVSNHTCPTIQQSKRSLLCIASGAQQRPRTQQDAEDNLHSGLTKVSSCCLKVDLNQSWQYLTHRAKVKVLYRRAYYVSNRLGW